jgi:hypothetical protein
MCFIHLHACYFSAHMHVVADRGETGNIKMTVKGHCVTQIVNIYNFSEATQSYFRVEQGRAERCTTCSTISCCQVMMLGSTLWQTVMSLQTLCIVQLVSVHSMRKLLVL